ncbi:fluoride efflux transporter CrcB [Variovorax sp. PAMC 28711]|uniref:fluoride efflux transporter CrcB n=1 Tax=Variovorax sp. PAMC 28711 TaxID=1795631 RepID=UPI00078EDF79|nr:fluoride efflux transporter CrcB [Variovorax sp. PAMC 28711]AMM25685.1 fluoride ion transporter CrcB [Variovorax sp. PAMC 28711]
MLLPVIAICIGASLGALSRWSLALWFGVGGLMPWGTLSANLIGGYLIGVAIASFQLMPGLDPVWRLAIVTGFLGGLTTFSSFSAEVVTMLLEGRLGVALLTGVAHLCGSLLLTWVGIRTVQALAGHT